MHGHAAVHVRPDMNKLSPTLQTLDAHEKTIDLRVERLAHGIDRANAIWTDDTPALARATRAVTVLVENRLFVTAHAQTITERIVQTLPHHQQDGQLLAEVRPLTLLIEQANTAIVRMRTLIGAHQ